MLKRYLRTLAWLSLAAAVFVLVPVGLLALRGMQNRQGAECVERAGAGRTGSGSASLRSQRSMNAKAKP